MAAELPNTWATEQPQVSNRQVDMLVRNDRGVIQHVEFQATNEAGFPFRMLDYWVYLRRQYRQPASQSVLYIFSEPMRLEAMFEEGRTTHGFDVVDLKEYEQPICQPRLGRQLMGARSPGRPGRGSG